MITAWEKPEWDGVPPDESVQWHDLRYGLFDPPSCVTTRMAWSPFHRAWCWGKNWLSSTDVARLFMYVGPCPDQDKPEDQYPPAHGLPARERMKPGKDLRWGETPYDDLTRGELLRLVQAQHSALVSCSSVLRLMRTGQKDSPFWLDRGAGYGALHKAMSLLKLSGALGMNDESESIHRSFFRYADSLLFPDLDGARWYVTPDGAMFSPGPPREGQEGARPMEWKDLLPNNKEDQP